MVQWAKIELLQLSKKNQSYILGKLFFLFQKKHVCKCVSFIFSFNLQDFRLSKMFNYDFFKFKCLSATFLKKKVWW